MVCWLLVLIGCREKSAAEQVIETLKNMQKHAQSKNITMVMESIAADFHDAENRGKKEVETMLLDYFANYKGIVIHLLATDNLIVKESSASLQAEVSISSGAAKVLRSLLSQTGRFFRFSLTLKKNNQSWQIDYAEWQDITMEQLLPKSLEILENIFPH